MGQIQETSRTSWSNSLMAGDVAEEILSVLIHLFSSTRPVVKTDHTFRKTGSRRLSSRFLRCFGEVDASELTGAHDPRLLGNQTEGPTPLASEGLYALEDNGPVCRESLPYPCSDGRAARGRRRAGRPAGLGGVGGLRSLRAERTGGPAGGRRDAAADRQRSDPPAGPTGSGAGMGPPTRGRVTGQNRRMVTGSALRCSPWRVYSWGSDAGRQGTT